MKEKTDINIEKELLDFFKEKAKQERITLSAILRKALWEYYDKQNS